MHNILDIRQIAEETEKEVVEVDTISVLGENDIILDIRSLKRQMKIHLNQTSIK